MRGLLRPTVAPSRRRASRWCWHEGVMGRGFWEVADARSGRGPYRIWQSQRRGERAMSMSIPAPAGAYEEGWRARVQKLGGFLAGMVIPNIGAFIAWRLITAFVIPTGWIPSEKLPELVGPMVPYLLPILIGYTGGGLVHGRRGAVVGAVATAGIVVGADIPRFLGAMIVGPLVGWLLKQLHRSIEGHIPAGFEMLVGNFSIGILGAILAILGFLAIGP